jgi:anti-sigma B factor antagonist
MRQKLLACADRNPWCCLDLSQVTFMDSSALGVLVAMIKAVRGRGEFHLFGIHPRIDELFRLTGLKRVFPCHETETDCLEAMRSGRADAA